MSEILSNTGVKLWAETDYSELWLTVFDQLTGQGGKSNIRLIDEAIGKINTALDGYKFEFSSDEDRLYISKGDSKLPVSLIDSNGHVASKVDGVTITIDESGVVKGIPVDDALSEESTNPLQNKVIAGELKSIKSKMGTDESAIKQNTSDITSNTKRIEANETAISTLNGTGNGSVKKAVSDGIAKVVAGAPEDFDTLKEMSDWISTHETSASAMNSQIQDNKKAIDNHVSNGDIHVTTENKTNWNKVSEKLDKTGDASNVTTGFTTATTRSNLTTKEKLSTSLGKIAKWFSDLKAVAFSGSYNDLNDKPTSLPASDVSAWAKESTKPTYTKSEVGLGNVDNTADANKSVKYATSAGSASSVAWNNITGKPSTYPPSSHTHTKSQITDFPNSLPANGGNSDTANSVTDYNNANVSIKIGYYGLGLKVDQIRHIAGFAGDGVSDIRIKDVSKNELKSWLGDATTSDHGLMTPAMVSKLNGIAEGANRTTVDSGMSDTSTNAVQNKVVKSYVDNGLNTLKKSVSDGKTKVANAITDKGVETATDATFDVMAENISKIETGGGELHGATLAVSTEESTLFGQTVTLTLDGSSVATTVFADNGMCSFVVQNPGTYTITCGEAHKDATVTSDNVLYKTVISVNLSLLKIVTFSSGTDEEIAKMIQAHYNNKINLSDYWAVGDMRTVHLSAMAATGVGESHRAQTVQFVIGDFDHDDLATPINGHTKAAVTLLQKDCLMDASNASNPVNGSSNTENGYMNSANTNVGGWKSCARRTWCNNVFFAALPSVWQSMVKAVNKKTSAGNGQSTIETVQDKVFLASEIEIFGSTTYSFAGEGIQYQYYKNATVNRYKMPKLSSSQVSNIYYERSPYRADSSFFCSVSNIGNANFDFASFVHGIATCLCI